MSLLRTIKAQLGLSNTPANNFTLDASADNGTMKLARNNGQDIMTVDAAGKVAFPQLSQSLITAGYATLPNGLIIQWGELVISTTAANTWAIGNQALPIAFPTACLLVLGNLGAASSLSAQTISGQVRKNSTNPLTSVTGEVISGTGAVPNIPLNFIAIGF